MDIHVIQYFNDQDGNQCTILRYSAQYFRGNEYPLRVKDISIELLPHIDP